MKHQILKILVIVFLADLTFSFYPNNSFSQDSQYLKYKGIILLLKDKKYDKAGQILLDISLEELKEGKKLKKGISSSLFSLVLAGISFEKSRDTITYDIWKMVNKGYLKTNTNWESERKKIEEKILMLSETKEKTPDDIALLEIDNLLKVSSYSGPVNTEPVKPLNSL